jgi:nicotinamidase-related amidase
VSDRYTEPDFASAALITIDVQRDTLDGGPIEVPGTSAALPAMHALVEAFRETGREEEEVVIYKPRWGAFYGTRLEDHLRERQVSTVVLCGCNYPNCPRTSAYEASERDFRVVFARDAVSGLYDRGERELAAIGVALMTSVEVAHALATPAGVRRSDP